MEDVIESLQEQLDDTPFHEVKKRQELEEELEYHQDLLERYIAEGIYEDDCDE